jgi:hypothetical protein
MSVPMDRNPALRPGLAALIGWLLDHSYSSHMIGRIEGHAAVHGTLAGSLIEPEDEPAAEEAFISALPVVGNDSPAWDDPSVFLDAETLLAGGYVHVPLEALVPPELEPEPFAPSEEDEAFLAALEAAAVPPVSGGAPAGPTDEDLAEALETCRRADRLGAPPRDIPEPPVYGYE